MSYKVKLDIFEGPFDLLVYLIENAEMNIYDIQVSEITSQYLDYIKRMQAMDVALGSEFMVLAAALIEIKSKMLLPRLKTNHESEIMEDPRTELVERILEYKRYKMVAEMLQQQEEFCGKIYQKPKEDLSVYTNEPDELLSLDINQFITAFHVFIAKKKKVEEIKNYYEKVERQKISIESRIAYIKNLFTIYGKERLNFDELIEEKNDKYEIVLTFSSMLEMIRQRTIQAYQDVNFGEIVICLNAVDKNVADKISSNKGGEALQ